MKRKLIAVILFSLLFFFGCDGKDYLKGFKSIGFPGNISNERADLIISADNSNTIYFTKEFIRQYPAVKITLVDPWDNIEHTYTGINLFHLLSFLGLSDENCYVDVTADNNYSAPITLKDLKKYTYLLAYKIDEYELPNSLKFANRHNFVIAIDFPSFPEIDQELYQHQLVWQVKSIHYVHN